MPDGFGVETSVEGGDCGSLSADKEFDVAEEVGDALGLGLWRGLRLVVGGIFTGQREFIEGKDVIGQGNAFTTECGGG